MNNQSRSLNYFIYITLIFASFLVLTSEAIAKPLYDTPVYNPDTKSYFELAPVPVGYSVRAVNSPEASWAASQRLASQRVFKNVRGRLAIVKTKQVNDFLRKVFKPDKAAWIGLRYLLCYGRLMRPPQLVQPEPMPLTDFLEPRARGYLDGRIRLPVLQTGVFRSPQGKLGVFVVNVGPEPVDYEAVLPLDDYGLSPGRGHTAVRVDNDGTRQVVGTGVKGEVRLSGSLPARGVTMFSIAR